MGEVTPAHSAQCSRRELYSRDGCTVMSVVVRPVWREDVLSDIQEHTGGTYTTGESGSFD